MKSVSERMKEYLEYHKNGDADCNTVVMRKYVDNHGFNLKQRFIFAYFFALTYSIPSAIVLFYSQEELWKDIDTWVLKNKHKLIFQSDRKYVKMKNCFNKALKYFKENLLDCDRYLSKVTQGNKLLLPKAIPETETWVMFGRFSTFLFLETLCSLTDYEIENSTIDWEHGDTATSGMLNLFGLDNSANYFDKNDHLPSNITPEKMDEMLELVITEIEKYGGNTNVTTIETSLCAYRKFYKGTRYNGYYLDRMLEEIYTIMPYFPDISKELLELRAVSFNQKYLGEFHNWTGVRKECKKSYIETGVVM